MIGLSFSAMVSSALSVDNCQDIRSNIEILKFTDKLPASLMQGIYETNKQDIENAYEITGDRAVISAASSDLNNDGIKEVLVFIEGQMLCANAGCPLIIYRHENKKLEEIQKIFTIENIAVSHHLTLGYRDMIASYDRDDSICRRWPWNGSQYIISLPE